MDTALLDSIKAKLFDRWLPDKPGGLKGLIELAAEVSLEAVLEVSQEGVGCGHGEELVVLRKQVEDLTKSLHFAELGKVDKDDEMSVSDLLSNLPQYSCTECGHPHRMDSKIGQEHLSKYLSEQVVANVEPVTPGDVAGR